MRDMGLTRLTLLEHLLIALYSVSVYLILQLKEPGTINILLNMRKTRYKEVREIWAWWHMPLTPAL